MSNGLYEFSGINNSSLNSYVRNRPLSFFISFFYLKTKNERKSYCRGLGRKSGLLVNLFFENTTFGQHLRDSDVCYAKDKEEEQLSFV